MSKIKILGLGGSLDSKRSEESVTLTVLKVALEGARETGAEVECVDIGALRLPIFDQNLTPPTEARELAEKVRASHGMIWCSPLYHGSMSGLMKNTLDWLELLSEASPKYLGGMPVGLAATAGGTQAIQAINSMEYVVRALRGFTVPLVAPVNQAWNGWDGKTEGLLKSMGAEVAKSARMLRA